MTEEQNHERDENDFTSNCSQLYQSIMIKNIVKITSTRGKENVIIIDNNLYSYINHLDLYIPVPKFKGNDNSNLFFLKFYLEDFLNGKEPICNHLLEEYLS